MFKILSWNVNGIRSISQKGYLADVCNQDFDVICFQEVKLTELESLRQIIPNEYYIYGNIGPNGRNGVVVLSRHKAQSAEYRIDHERFDSEGRYIKINFEHFSMINLYMPHGGRDKSRLPYKLEVAKILKKKLNQFINNKVIIATDFNIARSDIDVCRADQNHKNIMFTEEERAVINDICKLGYKDAFRALYPEKVEYTWWSYAFECRKRNIGWRIDYFLTTEAMMRNITNIEIIKEQMGSDHCPITITIDEVANG